MTVPSGETTSPHHLHHQLILFGPPGTSKSRRARDVNAEALGASGDSIIPVMFHPDYSYGEFVARLLPISENGGIQYNVHAGPFIRALAMAYIALGNETVANVVLLIDEINRGNCAEIFGDIFQLLDRDDEGWSCYETSVSELVIKALDDEMWRLNPGGDGEWLKPLHGEVERLIEKRQLRLPPNLYFIGTMNTSDESVYFMDSAFKRRWNFEFRSVGFHEVAKCQRDAVIADTHYTWSEFVDALNDFILDRCPSPKMDDKLVGPWFIKARDPKHILPTLRQKFSKEWESITEYAKGVAKHAEGADYSERFEKAVLALTKQLPASAAEEIKELAGYDPTITNSLRRFHRIERSASSAGYPYYLKKSKNQALMGIDDFIARLGEMAAEETVYAIDRETIAGKLMLYLWDNVFDRDKSPLAALLGVEPRMLRTFGQFTDRVDDFIERVCERASAGQGGETELGVDNETDPVVG